MLLTLPPQPPSPARRANNAPWRQNSFRQVQKLLAPAAKPLPFSPVHRVRAKVKQISTTACQARAIPDTAQIAIAHRMLAPPSLERTLSVQKAYGEKRGLPVGTQTNLLINDIFQPEPSDTPLPRCVPLHPDSDKPRRGSYFSPFATPQRCVERHRPRRSATSKV